MNLFVKKFLVISVVYLYNSEVLAATLFHISDFESGTTEGWDGAPPTNQSSGGPLGAGDSFLEIVSSGTGGNGSKPATFNETPDWIGDYAAAGIDAIAVDMMVPQSSDPLEMRLVLFGPTTTNNRWTSTNAAMVPNDGVWRNYVFPVAEADLTFVPLAGSSATYGDLITSVLRVMLRHDAGTPSPKGTAIEATLGIDNVELIELVALPDSADFDVDGDVDGDDFLTWQRGFLTGTTSAEGDANNDNRVDESDLAVWENQYGAVGASIAVSNVPEPQTISLAIFCLVLAVGQVRIH